LTLDGEGETIGRVHVDETTIAAQVREVVAQTLELPVGAVRPEHELDADLGVDSLGMIQIGVALEEALGFRAPDVANADAHPLPRTVQELVGLVQAQLCRP
jgi:acyl carrier protein